MVMCFKYKVVDVRSRYYLWYHAISLLFRGNLSRNPPMTRISPNSCSLNSESLKVSGGNICHPKYANSDVPNLSTNKNMWSYFN